MVTGGSYGLQDAVVAAHPLHHPGLLLGNEQNHCVHGQTGGPALLDRTEPLALLQAERHGHTHTHTHPPVVLH